MDLNGDGHHDWKDDAIYNNVIRPVNGKSSSGSSLGGWKIVVIAVAIYFIVELLAVIFE